MEGVAMNVRSRRRAGAKPAFVIGVAAPLALGVSALAGCSGTSKVDTQVGATDAGADASSFDSSIFVVPGDAATGCDLASDPKANPCVVTESNGVFVSSMAV